MTVEADRVVEGERGKKEGTEERERRWKSLFVFFSTFLSLLLSNCDSYISKENNRKGISLSVCCVLRRLLADTMPVRAGENRAKGNDERTNELSLSLFPKSFALRAFFSSISIDFVFAMICEMRVYAFYLSRYKVV